MNRVIKPIVTVIAVLSIIAVIFTILFADSLLKSDKGNTAVVTTTKSVNITFDTDPLILKDGKNIDLMSGVSATDSQGNDVTKLVKASVTNSSNNEKSIMYSINDSDYNLETTKRGLQLLNYKGPKIAVKHTTYTCDINEIDSYIKSMVSAKCIVATDGYGNDISSALYVDSAVQVKAAGNQKVRLTVKNSFADSVSRDIVVNVTGTLDETRVVLSTKSISVKAGTAINPEKYIATAVDKNGNDIKSAIVIQNDVDINTPGNYNVYYYLPDETDAAPAATLTVVVTE
ncbi:immunoglobulin-like domain-containing protein [Oscillospiraceae bacterium LCP25S3_E10]|nr:hypothetical protein [Ruminococcus sp.]MDY2855938.1 DUF5011 domain-containing protein [Oscillospiraceae bacterium]